MTDRSTLNLATTQLFEATLHKVSNQLKIIKRDVHVGLKLLSKFESLKKYKSVFVHHVTELKEDNGSFIIMLVEKHLTILEFRKHAILEKEIDEVEPVMIFSIPHDIGRVLIRRETITDKVMDLLTKVDNDFAAYPNFSKNYLVVGERPDLVKAHLPEGLLTALENIKDMTVEIHGNWGLARPEKNLTQQVLLRLLSMGYKIIS